MSLYVFGCIALGITTGFLVGASSSPVVQYVLPLLFALLVSSASIFALKSTWSATNSDAKLRLVGASAAALTLPFLLATMYGTLVRTGSSLSSLVPGFSRIENFISSDTTMKSLLSEDILKIKLVDINLAAAGVGISERDLVTSLIAERRATEISNFLARKKEFASRLLSSTSELENFIRSKKEDESTSSSVEKLFARTSVLSKVFANDMVSISENIKNLSNLRDSMTEVLSEDEIQKNQPLMTNLVSMFSLIISAPDIEVINPSLRQEIVSLLKTSNTKTASVFEQLPYLARTDPPFDPRT